VEKQARVSGGTCALAFGTRSSPDWLSSGRNQLAAKDASRRRASIFVPSWPPGENLVDRHGLIAPLSAAQGPLHEAGALRMLGERREPGDGLVARAMMISSPASALAMSSEKRALASPMFT